MVRIGRADDEILSLMPLEQSIQDIGHLVRLVIYNVRDSHRSVIPRPIRQF